MPGWGEAIWEITRIVGPSTIGLVFCQLTHTINAVYAAKLEEPSMLAGFGLGYSLVSCMTLAIIVGMNGALETLVAQAFGAGQLELCGVYLNRGRLINTVIFIPLSVLLCFAGPVLKATGQDEEVIEYAMIYVLVNLPGVYLDGMFDLTKRFLNCCRATWIPMLAQIVATVLHIFWCHVFVVHMEWGIAGIGLALTVTNCSLLVSTMLYASCLPEI